MFKSFKNSCKKSRWTRKWLGKSSNMLTELTLEEILIY